MKQTCLKTDSFYKLPSNLDVSIEDTERWVGSENGEQAPILFGFIKMWQNLMRPKLKREILKMWQNMMENCGKIAMAP